MGFQKNAINACVWKQTQLLGTLCFVFCAISGCSARFVKHIAKPYAQAVRRKADVRHLKVGNGLLDVHIAETWRDRKFGLVGCHGLKENEGMLFVSRREKTHSFQMKYVDVPLSAAFIDRNGVIDEIVDLEPGQHSWTRSSGKVLFALQVPLGWFEKNGVSEGDKVNVEDVTDKHYCPHYALDLGVQFEKQDQFEDALECYDMVLRDYPSHVFAMTNIGNVHLKMGNYYKAGFWYRRALRIDASSLSTLCNLGEAYLAKGRVRKGICRQLETCISTHPDCAEKACAFDTLARLYAFLGKYEQALSLIELAICHAQTQKPGLIPSLVCHRDLILKEAVVKQDLDVGDKNYQQAENAR